MMNKKDVDNKSIRARFENYPKIVKEIINSSDNLEFSILNVLHLLSKENPDEVYRACKIFLNALGDYYIVNSGHLGLCDMWLKDTAFPGDIIIYSVPSRLKTNDLIQYLAVNLENNRTIIVHARIISLLENNLVKVKDIFTQEEKIIPQLHIIGKVVKIIPFGSNEWNELYPRIGYESNDIHIRQVIDAYIGSISDPKNKYYSKMSKEEKERLLDELNLRKAHFT
ncbi:MAG: hypothetical protein N3F64_04990 [Nitrososphaeria archaeon]|nr:hypothetical protein [Nitrososphaeria archaeon]